MADEKTGDRQRPRRPPARESPLALRGRILLSALSDVRFRDALLRDPSSAVARAMGETGYRILVHQERPREFVLLVPQRTFDLDHYLETVDADFRLFHTAAPTRTQIECFILKKAFDDPKYYGELRKSPRDTLNRELSSFGGQLPADVEVTLLIEEPGEVVVVLPSPTISTELSDAELDAVAVAAFPVAWIVGATVSEIGKVVVGSTVGATVGSVVSVKMAPPAVSGLERQLLGSELDDNPPLEGDDEEEASSRDRSSQENGPAGDRGDPERPT